MHEKEPLVRFIYERKLRDCLIHLPEMITIKLLKNSPI